MNKEITDKTFVAVLYGDVRIYLNESERDDLKKELLARTELIDIGKYSIKYSSVMYIVSAKELELADKIKRGFWQCKEGHWNDRGTKKCSDCYY